MLLNASERVDLVPMVGVGRIGQEACIDQQCLSADDTAVVFSRELRIFVITGALEVTVRRSHLESAAAAVRIVSTYF